MTFESGCWSVGATRVGREVYRISNRSLPEDDWTLGGVQNLLSAV